MGLLAAIAGLIHPAPPPDPATHQALERIAEQVDPLLKTVADFEKRLAAPAHHAIGYCEGFSNGVPGPIAVDRAAFGTDPLVHALFATPDDIHRMLGHSQSIRDYLADPASLLHDNLYFVLAARRQEKTQLGLGLNGSVIQNDVPQTLLYFCDHAAVFPAPSLDALKQRVRQEALDSLLNSFRAHVDTLRAEREELRTEATAARGHLTLLRQCSACGEDVAVQTRRLEELDTRLREDANALQPDHLVDALANFLLIPERSLSLEPVHITVDRVGVVQEPAAASAVDVDTISFPELHARDRRRFVVMYAMVRREEAQQAVEEVKDLQRRYMIL